MSTFSWSALAEALNLESHSDWLEGVAGPYPAGVTCRAESTWLGLVVANPQGLSFTLTRRWEPQARNPRRPDARTVRFRDIQLTERYVGTASKPEWFRAELSTDATAALIRAADANRLGSCAVDLRGHLLTARYRASVQDIPDLPETLVSLQALAACLDGERADVPDVQTTPLCSPDASRDALRAVKACLEERLLTLTLPKASGLLHKLQPAPRLTIDWDAQRVHGPALDFPLGCIRQVIARHGHDGTVIELVDQAGGRALSCIATNAPSLEEAIPVLRRPPFVFDRSERIG